MQAVVVEHFGGPETVQIREVRNPFPGAGEVLIQVVAAAVNAVDIVTRAGLLAGGGLHGDPPVRLGWDVAGTVTAVGPDVRRIRRGQKVIGLSDRLTAPTKTHGQQVVLDEGAVAAVPDSSDLLVLSSLPLAGLTAWQALELCELRPGGSLLVTGAAGNVGSVATRLALLDGITVLGAGRAAHREAIEKTGAVFIDAEHLDEEVHARLPIGVDAVVDAAVIGSTSADAVRRGGRHVSLNVTERPAPLRGITTTSLAVRADWRQLTILAALYESGALELSAPAETYPLGAAKAAYAAAATRRVAITP